MARNGRVRGLMILKHGDFKHYGLPAQIVETLTKLGFNSPTPIQSQGIPPVMAGKDLLALAPTGTGKTGAFGIPALSNLLHQKEKQVLILAPTRELATQIMKFLTSVVTGTQVRGALLVGGDSISRQFSDWNSGVDYIVATPGRLMDHVSRGLDLKHVGILILDEVDRMLDMGFAPQIEEIVKLVPSDRQTLFFSATLPPEIQKLVQRYLKDPVRVTVGAKKEDAPKIREERIQAKGFEKIELLKKIIKEKQGKIIIFTRTQMFTEKVSEQLEFAGIQTARLHGGRLQWERTRSLDAFRRGLVRVLVATDIAARGIDVADVEVVINFDKAATREDHTHRIGRTGRFGKEGLAITFIESLSREGNSRRERRQVYKERSQRFDAVDPRLLSPKERDAQALADSDPRNYKHRRIVKGVHGRPKGRPFHKRSSGAAKPRKQRVYQSVAKSQSK